MGKDKEWVKCYQKGCGHEWECGSKLMFVTCPNCMRKIDRKKAHIFYLDSRPPTVTELARV